MIGFIKGTIIFADGKSIIIDNNGIGYRIECCNLKLLEGDKAEVFVSTYMRENELKLFGFKTQIDLRVFELLLDVNGVGPKAALLLVGTLGSYKIINSIQHNKPESLKIKGIGEKTAIKIVLDLASKLKTSNLLSNTKTENDQLSYDEMETSQVEEAKEALMNLGFKEHELERVVNKNINTIKNIDKLEGVIKFLLNELKK